MYDDHVVISIDWSQIELVLIGEFSGDPFFHQCYSRLPYDDLHVIACADVLQVAQEEFVTLKMGTDFLDIHGADHPLLLNPKGERMEPQKAYKWWRTEVGKGSNFSYWYSGALSQVAERLGWSTDEMWEASRRYREKFAVAEEWRVGRIHFGQEYGYAMLPDGHRRTRFEATPMWAQMFRQKWARHWARHGDAGVQWFAEQVVRRVQSRANNQLINAEIQGSCATLAKRSIPRINRALRELGWGMREARFMFMVHDELVYSCHRDLVSELISVASRIMCDHPDIISNLKMDCSPSVGLTFEPWHPKKARLGQIELREAPEIDCVPAEFVEGYLPESYWPGVVDWLFRERARG